MDMAMDILATDMVVMDTMDIMARGPLMLSQAMDIMVMDMAMDILATDMVVMDTMDIMARGPLMLSQAMDIMVTDMVMDMAMDMDMVTMDTMARDLLSQDMDIMAMVMDTMVKQNCCSLLEFSTNEVGLHRSSQKTHNFHLTEINIKKEK